MLLYRIAGYKVVNKPLEQERKRYENWDVRDNPGMKVNIFK